MSRQPRLKILSAGEADMVALYAACGTGALMLEECAKILAANGFPGVAEISRAVAERQRAEMAKVFEETER